MNMLEHAGLMQYIDVIIASAPKEHEFSGSESLRRASKLLKKKVCIYIGHTAAHILNGHLVGAFTIAFNSNPKMLYEIIEAGPDFVTAYYKQIRKLLEGEPLWLAYEIYDAETAAALAESASAPAEPAAEKKSPETEEVPAEKTEEKKSAETEEAPAEKPAEQKTETAEDAPAKKPVRKQRTAKPKAVKRPAKAVKTPAEKPVRKQRAAKPKAAKKPGKTAKAPAEKPVRNRRAAKPKAVKNPV